MEASSFEGLPPLVQTAFAVAVFLITTAFGVIGYVKKHWATKLGDQKAQDAVVISAAFADSQKIEELGHAVKELHAAIGELHEAARASREVTASLVNATNYATEAIRSLTLELARKSR